MRSEAPIWDTACVPSFHRACTSLEADERCPRRTPLGFFFPVEPRGAHCFFHSLPAWYYAPSRNLRVLPGEFLVSTVYLSSVYTLSVSVSFGAFGTLPNNRAWRCQLPPDPHWPAETSGRRANIYDRSVYASLL